MRTLCQLWLLLLVRLVLTLYQLWLLLLVRLGGYKVNLSDFYSYRLIGKLTAFFQLFSSFRSSTCTNQPWSVPLPTRSFRFTTQKKGWPVSH
jgi:hypothetical protein